MPSDVSLDVLAQSVVESPRRLPVGIGLGLGACASIGLWLFVGLSLKAFLV